MKNLFRLLLAFILLLAINSCAGLTNAQKAHNLLKHGYYYEAIKFYTKAIDEDNLSVISLGDAYFNRGRAKYETNDSAGALDDFSKAIEVDPRCAMAYYGRGSMELEKYDFDGAIADYSKALEIGTNPTDRNIATYENRGLAKLRKNDYDGAIADFSKAIELDPKTRSYYANRGWAKMGKFDYNAAIIDFDKSIDLDSEYHQAFLGRGFAFFYADKPDKAIADFEEAFKIAPSDPYTIWLFLARKKNKKDGRSELKKYRDQYPNVTAWTITMQLYLGEITIEEYLTRVTNEDEYLQDKKQKCEAYFYIGQFYLLHGDAKKAKEYLQKSLGVGHGTSGTIAYQVGRLELQRLNQKN